MSQEHRELKATEFGADEFRELCQKAAADPRLRSHCNIHQDLAEPCQRLLIAIQPGSYIRPHRHLIHPKPETIFCVAGSIGVIIFDDLGQPHQTILLNPNGKTKGCDIPAGAWHSIISLSSDSVFLETKPGPYIPFQADDFASWSPTEPDEDFMHRMLSLFEQA